MKRELWEKILRKEMTSSVYRKVKSPLQEVRFVISQRKEAELLWILRNMSSKRISTQAEGLLTDKVLC